MNLKAGDFAARSIPVTSLAKAKNVAAILPGEGPHANEAIVIGAHYDHLGYGQRSTLPSKTGPVYHGADDNASGVADVLEIAHTLAHRGKKLHRKVIFLFFTGEEWGFWGSSYYVNHPVVPLNKTVAMLNLDMVGRLRDDKLTINSVGTGTGFGALIDQMNKQYHFDITQVPGASGRSDQAAFYAKRVPNLHFFTGKHPDYHQPTDTFDGLNLPGIWLWYCQLHYRYGRGDCRFTQATRFYFCSDAAALWRIVAAIRRLHTRLHPRRARLSDQQRYPRQSGG